MTEQSRIAVITGSNRGLGYEIAKKLGQRQGIQVVLTSRGEASGRAAQEKLAREGVSADYHSLDVNSDRSVQAFTEWLSQTYRHCTEMAVKIGKIVWKGLILRCK